jgi:ParB-like chromosome segregation protein Spo0J
MSEMSQKQLDHLDPIIVIRNGSSFQILDGVHRAAASLYVGRKSIKSVEFYYHE